MDTLSGNDPRRYNDIKDPLPVKVITLDSSYFQALDLMTGDIFHLAFQPTVGFRMPSWNNVETALQAMIPGSDIWPEEDEPRNRNSKWRSSGDAEKTVLTSVSAVNDFFQPPKGSFFPLWRAGGNIPHQPPRPSQQSRWVTRDAFRNLCHHKC